MTALGGIQWARLPGRDDVRWRFLAILAAYVVIGSVFLGFNRTPSQIIAIVSATCLLDMFFHFVFRERKLLFPLSAAISGCSLAILTNCAHGLFLPMIPVLLTISSKYALTFNGRHVFNPTLFGIGVSLLIGNGMISAAPSYQWGGSIAAAIFVVTAAYVIFLSRIDRNPLTLAFLGFYFLALCLRAYIARFHVPPETLFLGAVTSAAFYLFTFFMITDPATSPKLPRDQVIMAACLVVFDLLLHLRQTLSTFFLAGLIYYGGRLVFLHARAIFIELRRGSAFVTLWDRLRAGAPRLAMIAAVVFFVKHPALWPIATAYTSVPPDFQLVKLDPEAAGIHTHPGNILGLADPKVANIAKWILSIGDGAFVADVDGDGLPDVFLTQTLKPNQDRAGLYRNLGGFRFERVPIPALDELVNNPTTHGIPSGAVFFDYDNDGAVDLFVNVAFGHPILLHNLIKRTGKLEFEDVTEKMGLMDYQVSVAATVADLDGDGKLDLIVPNAMSPQLRGYDPPVLYNIFKLPEPAYAGDRRMLNLMHQTWHNASNGGPKFIYMNRGDHFEKVDSVKLGFEQNRWSLDVVAGDLNGDGKPDLYFANDFGPDEMYINRGDHFESIKGRWVGQVGRDTYKGMNASMADFENQGNLDVYVSNVHEKLQAEGSLLFINDGKVDTEGAEAFSQDAARRGALNERRFGWGAGIGDLDRDGRLDILQANGMVDDAYDKTGPTCDDYWYWNEKIALTPPSVHGYTDNWADLRGRCIFPSEANRVYLNRGRYFEDVADRAGWTELGNSRGIALADFDGDGDLDVMVSHTSAPISIYRNDSLPKTWLGLDLVGDPSQACNRDAIGTRVSASHPDANGAAVTQDRELILRNGLSAQGDHRMLFGFDRYQGNIQVEVHWCGRGAVERLSIAPNRYYRLVQGEANPQAFPRPK